MVFGIGIAKKGNGIMTNEIKISKQRLLWMCRRGLLELDILLQKIVANHYDHLSATQLETFADILKESDNDLLAILMEQLPPPQDWTQDKIQLLEELQN